MVHPFLAITGAGRVKELDALESKPHCCEEMARAQARPAKTRDAWAFRASETFKSQDVKLSSFHFQFQTMSRQTYQATLALDNPMRPLYLGCIQRKDGHDMDLAIGCSGLSLKLDENMQPHRVLQSHTLPARARD